MLKLTDAQKEQIQSMYKDGKRAGEIHEHFKSSYGITIPSSTLSYIIHGKAPGTKRQYRKRQTTGGDAPPASTDNIKNLIDQLRVELEAYACFVIKKVRVELVKAIGETRKKRIDAGEDVGEFKAPEVKELGE